MTVAPGPLKSVTRRGIRWREGSFPVEMRTPMSRQSAPRIISSDDDIRVAMRSLRRRCAAMRRAHDLAGDPPLRLRAPGLEGLARIVVGQQVSVASADAIWRRLSERVKPFEARSILDLGEVELRACGLSGPKFRTLAAIARAVEEKTLDLSALGTLREEDVRERLTAVSGIGPWTADIFSMFCLGRADAFAPGDLALQEAARLVLDLDERPRSSELEEIALRWRPWRSVAARMLWAYYRVARSASSGAPA